MSSSVSAWLAESGFARFAKQFERIGWEQLMEMKSSDLEQQGLPPEACAALAKRIELRKLTPPSSSPEPKAARSLRFKRFGALETAKAAADTRFTLQ